MTPDEMRNTILKAIYSDSDLKETLVLKGGNALKLYNITDRSSQDLDFSIKESIRYEKENEGKKLQDLISDAFQQVGFLVVGFEFIEKPKKRNKDLPPFWGGYKISFAIVDTEKYQDKIDLQDPDKMKELSKYGENLENNSKKIEIDLSYDEYVADKKSYDLEGTTIYLYSPLMLVYEKIRASCQQLDDYKLVGNKTRARDLYDIYKILTNTRQTNLREAVLDQCNFYILENIFKAKDVPLELMLKLDSKKSDLAEDYKTKVIPQISADEIEEFDYIFFYNKNLFENLFKEYQNYKTFQDII
jgi:predicted nucleotidyltransferase component of viral defense system